ncbi:uncharacterized protein [Prorops nasuta]|uniref:uncharacterized protein n=1 Tax=Prorops nasuta TaxID=863751 RepID=UPI0034CF069A
MSKNMCDERLAEVLELFLLPNYNVVSTTYLDILLTHISETIKESEHEYCEKFQGWILKALDIWTVGPKPSQLIVTFTLKLVGILARNELSFHYLHCKDVFNKLYVTLYLRNDKLPASIKMACTTMLSDLVIHKSGRQWIIQSGLWKDMVKFAQLNHTLYVTRESQKFVWTLLLEEQQNTEFCKEVILEIARPLITSTFDAKIHQALEDTYLDQNRLLCTTLDLITGILENTVFKSLDNVIPEMFEKQVNLEMRVKALFEACISTRFLQHVHKLLLIILFMKLKRGIKGQNEQVDAGVLQKFQFGIAYVSMLLLSKKYIIELVKTNKYALIYWKKIRSLCEFSVSEQYKFEHQATVLMILPLCVCIKKDYINHDLFDMFVNKIFDVTCTSVQRLAYNIRDTIWKGDLPLEQICKVSIDMLLEITDIMDRDVAVITFQALCHILKNYMPESYIIKMYKDTNLDHQLPHSNNPATQDHQRKQPFKSILEGEPLIETPTLLASLLHGLAVMTEKFKLKWQECVETICLLSLAQEILNHPGISSPICVKALKVCKLAIHNFMPPNLALLVDSDSHMNELGPVLYKRLHDPNWEVRDSVLEVLSTIAIISKDKYLAFQKLLLENPFLPAAVDIAVKDGESYVRASALIFISNTVQINELWDKKLSSLDLLGTAIQLLENESEAIVRREAVILIKELYVFRKWQKSTLDSMSRAMAVTAVFDLHWEVKANALEYWGNFIKSHLTDQGMLDGSFPNVTFSKEHRKIVTLNEEEIKRRVNKALDELAKQKCLGVFLIALEDDSDFEVSKKAAKILSKFKNFLLKYKLDEPLPEVPLPKDSATMDSAYVRAEPNVLRSKSSAVTNNSCNVIEEIVDVNDANLLASIYQNSLKVEGDTERPEKKTIEHIPCVSKEDFLRILFNTDLDAFIEAKNKWLKTYTTSFSSILEDILTMHREKDINSMDCY